MSTRRRYDTTALVDKMRQERRRNLLLGFCAAGTLTGLVVFYVLNMRGMTIPEVPADVTPRPPPGGVVAPPVSAAPSLAAGAPASAQPSGSPTSQANQPPPAVEERPSDTSMVQVNLPAGALVWIDDGGAPRGTQVQLLPGVHSVRVKIGRHAMREQIEVRPNENLELRLDGRKKKLVVERHPVAPTARTP